MDRWITSVLDQNRTISPARAGPNQNCRPTLGQLQLSAWATA
jgi:hypothetical protein